jgi:hypothetical protein
MMRTKQTVEVDGFDYWAGGRWRLLFMVANSEELRVDFTGSVAIPIAMHI